MNHSSLLFCLALTAAACGNDDPKPEEDPPEADAGVDAQVPEQFCPPEDNARVHYVDTDPNACIGVDLTCTTEQTGFQNQCGCGCIDEGDQLCPGVFDPAVIWRSMDPAECDPTPPTCGNDEVGFSNSCGCGCVTHEGTF